jgi:hypothetical protein
MQCCKYSFRKQTYPGLRLGKMAISTAVTSCRETGSVRGKKICRPCWLQINLKVCGVHLQQFPGIFFLRKLALQQHVSYFGKPEKVTKFICIHSAIGMSMNFKEREKKSIYDIYLSTESSTEN